MFVTGCALNESAPSSLQGAKLEGVVHGGQQPVTGSTMQLYAVGTSGYGSASTALLTTAATTDSTGGFSITGDYTCPSASTQVYLTATGGNPGLTAGTNNSAIALMAALGNCGSLSASTNLVINEATTVAAVWSLAPFMTGIANVGSSSTNSAGIALAMSNAKTIVSINSGAALAAPGNLSPLSAWYPQYAVNSLANSLAACVNTNGSTTSGTPCQLLFAAASTPSTPTDTVTAALHIAQNPGTNVSSVFSLASGNPLFVPALSAAPNDWLLPIVYQASLKYAYGTEMDQNGTFWVTQWYSGCQFKGFSIGMSATAYTYIPGGGCLSTSDLVLDSGGNSWTYVDYGSPRSLVELNMSSSTVLGSHNGIYGAGPIALDSTGRLWTSCNAAYTVSPSFALAASLSSTLSDAAMHDRADASGNLWQIAPTAQGNNLRECTVSGASVLATDYTGGNVNSPLDLAIDAGGNVWVLNGNSTLSKFTSSGAPVTSTAAYSGGGLNTTLTTNSGVNALTALAIDGAGNVWAANNGAAGISEFSNSGSPISPSNGYGAYVSANSAATGGVPATSQPTSLAIDAAGDVWVKSGGQQVTVSTFLGAAAPTVMPLASAVSTNKLGTRP